MHPQPKRQRPSWLVRTIWQLGVLYTAVAAVASTPWGTIGLCAVAGGAALAFTTFFLGRSGR